MLTHSLCTVSIDLYQLAQRRTGPLTRVLIGDAQPNRWLVGPRRAVPYIEEVGTAAQVTRFVAATIPTIITLIRSREGGLKRREAAATAPQRHRPPRLRVRRPRALTPWGASSATPARRRRRHGKQRWLPARLKCLLIRSTAS